MEKYKLLLHVNELRRWDMAFGNMRKLIADVGENAVDIVVLANGPAVTAFTEKQMLADMRDLAIKGVNFLACRNSIKELCPGGEVCMLDDPSSNVCINKKGFVFKDVCMAEESLSPFIKVVPTGITEIVRRQSEGYAYVKP